MSFEEFATSIRASSQPPAGLSAPLQALWHDRNGAWSEAHGCVQDETSREAAWVHAYLHRKEGDEANADYWYRRAGRAGRKPATSLDEEWTAIAQALLAG